MIHQSCLDGDSACYMIAYRGGQIEGIVNSCHKEGACEFAAGGYYTIDDNFNIVDNNVGGVIGMVKDSCQGEFSCYDMAWIHGTVGDISSSCNGYEACQGAASDYGSISDGIKEGCNSAVACFELGQNSILDGQVDQCCNTEGSCEGISSLPEDCETKEKVNIIWHNG